MLDVSSKSIAIALAVAVLAGCTATNLSSTRSDLIRLRTNDALWINGRELDRYQCIDSAAVLDCKTQGSDLLPKHCACRL